MIASLKVQVPDSQRGSRKPWASYCIGTGKGEQGLHLEESPGLEQGLSQGLIEVEVESVVGVDVVSDPGTE